MGLKEEGEAAGRRIDAYMDTVRRMEPDIAMVDRDAALASIAISLRRIAEALENPAGIWHGKVRT